jgi:glutaredoxin
LNAVPSDRNPVLALLAGHDLAVYSADWCPDCVRLKRLLERERIPHRIIDIESDPAAAARLVRETGKRAIPYILVDETSWVRGYHRELPGRLDLDLLLQELGQAISRPMKEKRP